MINNNNNNDIHFFLNNCYTSLLRFYCQFFGTYGATEYWLELDGTQ